jgi:serine protease AprX
VKVTSINPVLQPRTSRPTDWKQGAADVVTIGAGSISGALLGPLAGGGAGVAAGAGAESMVVSEYATQDAKQLIKRQALVGMAAGASAGALQLAFDSVNPLLGIGLGVAVGALAAAALPGRAENPYNDHWANLETTQAPRLWEQGHTGAGVGVAVLDTGTDTHEVLRGRVAAFVDMVEGRPEQHDVHHHGTSMAGILGTHGKQGKYPGVAPNVHFVGMKVADSRGKVHPDKVADAIAWAVENRERYNIQVLNMSFAAESTDDAAQLARIAAEIEKAAEVGIITVASTGNDGATGPAPMMEPAAAPSAIAVGWVDTHGSTKPSLHRISEFSHISPEGSDKRATVVAPGSGWLQPAGQNAYLTDGGTSQAAAALAGVVALWKEAVPGLTTEQAKAALTATAVPVPGAPPEQQGFGSARAQAGLEYLLAQGA